VGVIELRHADGVSHLGAFRLTPTGLEVKGSPSFEDWEKAGAYLQFAAGAVQWWVGDWLNYGEQKYGETYTQAIELTGMDYDTLKRTKWVASEFELCRRRHNLTFAHHQEVASLPPAVADTLLTRAESEGLSTRDIRQLARQAKNADALDVPPSEECCTVGDLGTLVAKGLTFGTVYADPPWAYDNQGTRAATGNHYDTLTVDQLCELPVGKLAAPRSHLWLWTTNAFLFECPRLFAAWGFEFKSSYVWVKPQIGIGNYLRNSHEFLLLAVRGGLTAADDARDVMSWGEFARTEHSAKPEGVRSRVVQRVSPGPRLELFGRRYTPGWVVWGNQFDRGLFDAEVRVLTGES
jgi:N6-adenosine-specific RNA methylase IME4